MHIFRIPQAPDHTLYAGNHSEFNLSQSFNVKIKVVLKIKVRKFAFDNNLSIVILIKTSHDNSPIDFKANNHSSFRAKRITKIQVKST